MIDEKKFSEFMYQSGPRPDPFEMSQALSETFECPRCGRPDLPLALFPHHKS